MRAIVLFCMLMASTSCAQVVQTLTNAPGLPTILDITSFGTWVTPAIHGQLARGTPEEPQAVKAYDTLLSIYANGHDGEKFSTDIDAAMYFRTSEDWTPTAHGTQIDFRTVRNGTVNHAPALRLHNDKSVNAFGPMYPARLDGNPQRQVGIYAGPVMPHDNQGNEGDFYFCRGCARSIYQKVGGAWVGIL